MHAVGLSIYKYDIVLLDLEVKIICLMKKPM